MKVLHCQRLLSVVVLLILAGCANDSTNKPKILSLSLSGSEGRLQVTDYEVLDKTFQKSRQQGIYQAHLIDKEDHILQRISFEKLNTPELQNENRDTGFSVAVPLKPELNQIKIYMLDGSSGHYQLKDADPILEWTLPEAVKKN